MVALLSEEYSAFREVVLRDGQPTRLKFLSAFVTSGSRDWAELYADEGDLFVRIGNISGAGIDLNLHRKTFVDLAGRTEGLRTKLRKHDVLISITANLGSVAVVSEEGAGGYINQHVALVRPNDPSQARFIAHSLQTHRSTDEFSLRGYGGTKQGLSLEDVREVSILLPSPTEQQQRAKVLDERFSVVAQAQEAIEASCSQLTEFRAALITAAVTGQIDVATWGKRGQSDRRLDEIEREMAS